MPLDHEKLNKCFTKASSAEHVRPLSETPAQTLARQASSVDQAISHSPIGGIYNTLKEIAEPIVEVLQNALPPRQP
jgi:hypothetical protein